MGVAIGFVFSGAMVLAWLLVGDSRLDRAMFRASLEPFGLTDVNTYIAAAVFWTVGNSVLEEYVFRWFLVEKGEVLLDPSGERFLLQQDCSSFITSLHCTFSVSRSLRTFSLALGCSSAGWDSVGFT